MRALPLASSPREAAVRHSWRWVVGLIPLLLTSAGHATYTAYWRTRTVCNSSNATCCKRDDHMLTLWTSGLLARVSRNSRILTRSISWWKLSTGENERIDCSISGVWTCPSSTVWDRTQHLWNLICFLPCLGRWESHVLVWVSYSCYIVQTKTEYVPLGSFIWGQKQSQFPKCVLFRVLGGGQVRQQSNLTLLIFMDHRIVDESIEIPTRCSFVIEFIIPKFIEVSTCFERHTAHHQEL